MLDNREYINDMFILHEQTGKAMSPEHEMKIGDQKIFFKTDKTISPDRRPSFIKRLFSIIK